MPPEDGSASIDQRVHDACLRARHATRILRTRSTDEKNAVLARVATGLEERSAIVLEANARDLEAAKAKGIKGALLDRLMLDEKRLGGIARSVREIIDLPDPVGDVVSTSTRPNGLTVKRVRVPLGVIAMIYEARPNVTVEASALTLKAGNAVVLRGGSEAEHSNAALAAVIGDALEASEFPRAAVHVLPFTDRDAVRALVQQSELVDLAIPRGGEALIRFVTDNARVPVVQHYKGVCHLFVDASADLASIVPIVMDAKMQRPGVCNALECLLVDASLASDLLPRVTEAITKAGGTVRGCERTRAIVPTSEAAQEDDWGREFLDTILAVRVVDGLDGALEHVSQYGSGHTEAILTRTDAHAARWRREVDAACVVVNASTRFHDGGELGLGAEIGIATSRLHWRGPMGLEALTTMKWVVDGAGQTRG